MCGGRVLDRTRFHMVTVLLTAALCGIFGVSYLESRPADQGPGAGSQGPAVPQFPGGGTGQPRQGLPGCVVALHVADTDRFSPTYWRLRASRPVGGQDSLASEGYIRFFHVGGIRDGREVEGELADSMGRAGPGIAGVVTCGEPKKMWRCEAGASVEFMGEVADWRVLGYPGRYRAVVGDASAEFEVRPGGPQEGALLAAMQLRNAVWVAYIDFLNGKIPASALEPIAVPALPIRVSGTAAARDFALQLLDQPSHPAVVLGACAQLPSGLQQRLALMRALGEYRATLAGPGGAEQTDRLASLRSAIEAFGSSGGYIGAFSRFQVLLFSARHDPAASFAGRVQAARQDSDVCGVGRMFGDSALRIGLVDEERFSGWVGGPLPPRRRAGVGPQSPR
jgi:hypothetical protein